MCFQVGDKVEHLSMGRGEVTAIIPGSEVHVRYENSKTLGQYDDNWFRMHPGWLKKRDSDVSSAKEQGHD